MKALKIYEFQDFKRGQNPYKALGIGSDGDYKIIIFTDNGFPIIDEIFTETNLIDIRKQSIDMLRSKPTDYWLSIFKLEDSWQENFSERLSKKDTGIHRWGDKKTWYLVTESMNFKRGQNPHSALNIGDGQVFDWNIVTVDNNNSVLRRVIHKSLNITELEAALIESLMPWIYQPDQFWAYAERKENGKFVDTQIGVVLRDNKIYYYKPDRDTDDTEGELVYDQINQKDVQELNQKSKYIS